MGVAVGAVLPLALVLFDGCGTNRRFHYRQVWPPVVSLITRWPALFLFVPEWLLCSFRVAACPVVESRREEQTNLRHWQ